MSDRYFIDREDAACGLAAALVRLKGRHPLVLAIPRGGVPIGRIVADALDGELDVVLVRKLGAPGNPELAIGAVDEDGNVHLGAHAEQVGVDTAYVRDEAARQLALIRERRAWYGAGRTSPDPAGRDVIMVDDGLATGATMSAALQAVRARHPARLVCAVPVAAADSLRRVAPFADEVVCLAAPPDFNAVGQFYERFEPVGDDEVVSLLAAAGTVAACDPPVSRMVAVVGDGVLLEGELCVPATARGLVLFAHGSCSSRHSPRNRFVAGELNRVRLATLLIDLLTPAEDRERSSRFDIVLLAKRLGAVIDWLGRDAVVSRLPVGLFGASTGAAAALIAAVARAQRIAAVVARGGRPDLVDRATLGRLQAPVLLIVGGADHEVLELNRGAWANMPESAELVVVPGATHLFEEPNALEAVAQLAADWFARWLPAGCSAAGVTPPYLHSPAPRPARADTAMLARSRRDKRAD